MIRDKLIKKNIISVANAFAYGLCGVYLSNILFYFALRYFWMPVFFVVYLLLPVTVYFILRVLSDNKQLYFASSVVSTVIFFFLSMDIFAEEYIFLSTELRFFITVFLVHLLVIFIDFSVYLIRCKKKTKFISPHLFSIQTEDAEETSNTTEEQ